MLSAQTVISEEIAVKVQHITLPIWEAMELRQGLLPGNAVSAIAVHTAIIVTRV